MKKIFNSSKIDKDIAQQSVPSSTLLTRKVVVVNKERKTEIPFLGGVHSLWNSMVDDKYNTIGLNGRENPHSVMMDSWNLTPRK